MNYYTGLNIINQKINAKANTMVPATIITLATMAVIGEAMLMNTE